MNEFFKADDKKKKDPCEICGLYKNCQSPKMKVTGQGQKGILVIAEAPGEKEDLQGEQLIGKSGQLFRNFLSELNMDLDRDCWKTNAVICRPPNNRKPYLKEIRLCRQNLLTTIELYRPEKILLLGESAIKSLLENEMSNIKISKLAGKKFADNIFINYHPSYVMRSEDDALYEFYLRSLRKVFTDNVIYDHPKIPINVLNESQAITFLKKLNTEKKEIAFDYETTGLYPYNKNHRIVACSVCDGQTSNAFMLNGNIPTFLRDVLKNNHIPKIAHNIKFEHLWTDCLVKGWIWDTMLAEHLLDNQIPCRLKFLVYKYFGISKYDNEINPYLQSDPTGFNKINELPSDTLLEYCAKDSMYTYAIYQIQKKELNNHKAMNLFLKGAVHFAEMEKNGIPINLDLYKENKIKLTKRLNFLEKKINQDPLLEKWSGENTFSFKSTKDLRQLLFKDLKLKSIKSTKTGNPSVDVESLSGIRSPMTDKILRYRKMHKIQKTYLGNFLECVFEDDKLHPSFNLHIVKTYRSSCSNPNFQNIPKRDELAQKIVRSGIIPSLGNILMEVDYSNIEVRISACYHKDPVMINYINDPNSDMHRDIALQLFGRVDKHLRYLAKNGFVFPQFYGSYYEQCAPAIWKEMTEDEKYGEDYFDFVDKVKDVEYDFWNNRFKVYSKWKEENWKRYLKTGFIRTKIGFTYQGYMKRNEACNYAIQGTAFHCLLWSLIQINKWLKENNYRSKIIGQIHDSILLDVFPDEKKELMTVIKKISCEDICNHWKWIIVPLQIEFACSKVNGNWSEMEDEK